MYVSYKRYTCAGLCTTRSALNNSTLDYTKWTKHKEITPLRGIPHHPVPNPRHISKLLTSPRRGPNYKSFLGLCKGTGRHTRAWLQYSRGRPYVMLLGITTVPFCPVLSPVSWRNPTEAENPTIIHLWLSTSLTCPDKLDPYVYLVKFIIIFFSLLPVMVK